MILSCTILLSIAIWLSCLCQPALALLNESVTSSTNMAKPEGLRANHTALTYQGYTEIQKGNYAKAAKMLALSLQLNESNRLSRRYLCYALMQLGRYKEAAACASKLGRQPQALDYYLIAETNARIGKKGLALEQFSSAVTLDPHFNLARAGLSALLINNGASSQATKIIKEIPAEGCTPQLKAYFEQLYALTLPKSDSDIRGDETPGSSGGEATSSETEAAGIGSPRLIQSPSPKDGNLLVPPKPVPSKVATKAQS